MTEGTIQRGRPKKVFGRRVEITIFDPKEPKTAIVKKIPSVFVKDFSVLTVDGVSISDLRVAGYVSSMKDSTSGGDSPCKISIYNMSQATKSKIKVNFGIIIKAGYEQDVDLPIIYSGQIIKVTPERSGADILTRITCGGNSFMKQNLRKHVVFPPDTPLNLVFEEYATILRSTGTPIAEFDYDIDELAALKDTVLESGMAIEGNVLTKFAMLCDENDLRLYPYLGKYYVEAKSGEFSATAVLVTSQNIKGVIERDEDAVNKAENSSEPKVGLKFTTFLNGGIVLNKKIIVETPTENGIYNPVSIRHDFDTEGSVFDTTVSCKR